MRGCLPVWPSIHIGIHVEFGRAILSDDNACVHRAAHLRSHCQAPDGDWLILRKKDEYHMQVR